MTSERLIGVDVGGSKIKGAVVDLHSGQPIGEPVRRATPRWETPDDVATAITEVVGALSCDGTVGVALPCVVRDGVVRLAANLSAEWVDTDAVGLLTRKLGRAVVVLNDADAAGLAEARFGAAKDTRGTVLVLTFGTGIGSSIVHRGELVPNFEFGHTHLDGVVAEKRAAASVRERERLSWHEWVIERVNPLLDHLIMIVQPDLVVIGGGVARQDRVEQWHHLIKADVTVVPAVLANHAGLVGAGIHAFRETVGVAGEVTGRPHEIVDPGVV